ncbi:hypothetical protein QJQ45_000020 [Haematococcus lacustris]|nr:hypothetical protein QJQ45_000020 [Haematococcus lacustris]
MTPTSFVNTADMGAAAKEAAVGSGTDTHIATKRTDGRSSSAGEAHWGSGNDTNQLCHYHQPSLATASTIISQQHHYLQRYQQLYQ